MSPGIAASQRRTQTNVRDWSPVWLAGAGRQRGRVGLAVVRFVRNLASTADSHANAETLCQRSFAVYGVDQSSGTGF